MAYSASRLKPAASKAPAAAPEKKLEDMTLEEQLAYSAARLKPSASKVSETPVVEETKEPQPNANNSRFQDSFVSDADMADFSRVEEEKDTVAPLESSKPTGMAKQMTMIEED